MGSPGLSSSGKTSASKTFDGSSILSGPAIAHTPPINIRALAQKGILKPERFFRLLSEQNNYVDTKTIENFYMGLVRVLTQELRQNGVVRLPHIGDLALVKQKDRIGWKGKIQGMIQGKYVLKFYSQESWRKYFSGLEKKSGLEGALDPREKILGQELDEYGVEE